MYIQHSNRTLINYNPKLTCTHIAQSLKEIGERKIDLCSINEDWTHNQKWNPKAPY